MEIIMPDIQMYNHAYLDGIDAYNNQRHISENPYPMNTHEHALFNAGYMDGMNKIWVNKKLENKEKRDV